MATRARDFTPEERKKYAAVVEDSVAAVNTCSAKQRAERSAMQALKVLYEKNFAAAETAPTKANDTTSFMGSCEVSDWIQQSECQCGAVSAKGKMNLTREVVLYSANGTAN